MSKKSGMPKSAPSKSSKSKSSKSQKVVDNTTSADVSSATSTAASDAASTPAQPAQQTENHVPSITLNRSDKTRKSNAVVYTAAGYQGGVRFPKSFFTDKTGPETISVSDDSFAAARVARAKMTPEERKAARANAPKLTPQEKLAKIEERAQKLRDKIAKSAPAS